MMFQLSSVSTVYVPLSEARKQCVYFTGLSFSLCWVVAEPHVHITCAVSNLHAPFVVFGVCTIGT